MLRASLILPWCLNITCALFHRFLRHRPPCIYPCNNMVASKLLCGKRRRDIIHKIYTIYHYDPTHKMMAWTGKMQSLGSSQSARLINMIHIKSLSSYSSRDSRNDRTPSFLTLWTASKISSVDMGLTGESISPNNSSIVFASSKKSVFVSATIGKSLG